MFLIRQATPQDFEKVKALYIKVAEKTIGIARTGSEITETYIRNFMNSATTSGIELVIENPENPNQLVGEIHCYKLIPTVFDHILSELTIVVDPDFHGQGLGKILFAHLLDFVRNNRPDILRVELVARESNKKAIEFYRKIGFVEEGRLEHRIKSASGGFEADIPMAWFNVNFQRVN